MCVVGCEVLGGFGVQGLAYRVQGSGVRAEWRLFRAIQAWDLGFKVYDFAV